MKIAGIIVGLLLLLCIAPILFMWCWNGAVAPTMGWETVGFWQSVGYIVVAKILFGEVKVNNCD